MTVHRDKFLKLEPTRWTNFSKCLFRNETLRVSDSSSVHHQEFFIVHTAMVYVILVCWQLASRIRIDLVPSWSWSCSHAVRKPFWHIPLLYIQWKTPDDGQKNCPKHVEFHSKNKFEKLVDLGGCIIRENLYWSKIYIWNFPYVNYLKYEESMR